MSEQSKPELPSLPERYKEALGRTLAGVFTRIVVL